MRKKPKLILVGIFLLILSFGPMILNMNKELDKDDSLKSGVMDKSVKDIDIDPPKNSGLWIMSNITIDDDGGTYGALNWIQAEAEDWCSGQGTWSNPYIIENITIAAGGSGNGI